MSRDTAVFHKGTRYNGKLLEKRKIWSSDVQENSRDTFHCQRGLKRRIADRLFVDSEIRITARAIKA